LWGGALGSNHTASIRTTRFKYGLPRRLNLEPEKFLFINPKVRRPSGCHGPRTLQEHIGMVGGEAVQQQQDRSPGVKLCPSRVGPREEDLARRGLE
jgi:hypothetical protein